MIWVDTEDDKSPRRHCQPACMGAQGGGGVGAEKGGGAVAHKKIYLPSASPHPTHTGRREVT